MKWIVLIVVAIVVFLIFRRINREQTVVSYPTDPNQPTPTPSPIQTEFALRTPMAFDDFYRRYYAADNIDREFVRRVLIYVSKVGGVTAEQLRPEDRLDTMPNKSAFRSLKFVERFVGGLSGRLAADQGRPAQEVHLDTVDDLIRSLGSHPELFKGIRRDSDSESHS